MLPHMSWIIVKEWFLNMAPWEAAVEVDESRYIALLVFSGSIKKLFSKRHFWDYDAIM